MKSGPRRRVFKLVLISVLGIAVLAGVQYARWQWLATKTFERHSVEVAARIEHLRTQVKGRPPLLEPASAGDAGELYTWILKEVVNISKVGGPTGYKSAPADLDVYLKAHQPILDAIPRALQRPWSIRFGEETDLKGCHLVDREFMWNLLRVRDCVESIALGLHGRRKDAEAIRLLLLLGAMSGDLRRGFGEWPGPRTKYVEHCAFSSIRDILSSYSLTAAELADLNRLVTQISAFRPPVFDSFPLEDLQRREAILARERLGIDSEFPAWRNIFFPRLSRAYLLDVTKGTYADFETIKELPTPAWIPRAKEIAASRRLESVGWLAEMTFGDEVNVLIDLSMLKAAIALMRYETDHGRLPATLDDLIPGYGDSPFRCAGTRAPLCYDPGTGSLRSPVMAEILKWTIRRH